MSHYYRAFMIAMICVSSLCYSVNSSEISQVSNQQEQLRALMEERRNVMGKRMEILLQRDEAGVEPKEVVLMACEEFLQAELELARTKPERLTVLEQMLEIAKQIESVENEKEKSGTSRLEDVYKVRAFRLRCEIDLLQEKIQSGHTQSTTKMMAPSQCSPPQRFCVPRSR